MMIFAVQIARAGLLPLNRSSRREEALTSLQPNRVSLLTPAATSLDFQNRTRVRAADRKRQLAPAFPRWFIKRFIKSGDEALCEIGRAVSDSPC